MNYFYERVVTCECGFSYRQTALKLPLDETGEKISKQSQKHYHKDIICELKIILSDWNLIIPDRDYFKSKVPKRRRSQVERQLSAEQLIGSSILPASSKT